MLTTAPKCYACAHPLQMSSRLKASRRTPLSREVVIEAAVTVADRSGLAGVSMRTVAHELGVEAMSLYHHVKSKDDLLDELADWVYTTIEAPAADRAWREAMTGKASSTLAAITAHAWALGLMESRRKPGPALIRHHDTVLGCLRHNGFPVRLAMHTVSVLDAYVYGFALSELTLPMEADETEEEFAETLGLAADAYPHIAEMLEEQVRGKDYAFADEFDYGLTLILEGLEERLGSCQRGA